MSLRRTDLIGRATTFLATGCLLCLAAEAGANEFYWCVRSAQFDARTRYVASLNVEYAKEREIYATRDAKLKGCPKNSSCKTSVRASASAALKVVAQEKAVIQKTYRSELAAAYDICAGGPFR